MIYDDKFKSLLTDFGKKLYGRGVHTEDIPGTLFDYAVQFYEMGFKDGENYVTKYGGAVTETVCDTAGSSQVLRVDGGVTGGHRSD